MVEGWKIELTKRAEKDAKKIANLGFKVIIQKLIAILEANPYANSPPYEKLKDSANTHSRFINDQHRLVYHVFKKERIVRILRMWSP